MLSEQITKEMDKKGGAAFPFTGPELSDGSQEYYVGMTLRDYFAGQALAGLCTFMEHREVLADNAYRIADAMIERRKYQEDQEDQED